MATSEQEFALDGFDEVSGSESGNWVAIQSDGGSATYSATLRNGDALTSRDRAEGIIVYGWFKSIAVTSGQVIAYRKDT